MPATVTTVIVSPQDRTIRFAARELARHLRLATGAGTRVTSRATSGERSFTLCLADGAGVRLPLGSGDDAFAIIPGASGCVIAGANPRSVLFGVYRYLRELGFRWIRPGARGVVRPAKRIRDPFAMRRRIVERAAYRYRTICIEGACSREHVLDLIDWMAKRGMNGYFLQFDFGTYFFKRWYEHRGNPHLAPEPIDAERVQAIIRDVEAALGDRGMRFERMGHGWTCAALGISGEGGWDQDAEPVPADKVDWLAQVDGKRELSGGISLNTNLDYSNPAVRTAVVDGIVAYARTHPQVDLLHFWLADGANNHDERPSSQDTRPADFYVDMLNQLDVALSAAGLATRIVFLIYVDLLWPPERARIANPDRFTLMFAPITRSYTASFFAGTGDGSAGMTPYVRNKLQFPRDPAVNLAYLKAWQETFSGDGFDFDYHMWWGGYHDLAHMALAKVMHQDIRGLAGAGLHGFNSCQVTRHSFPHNLLMDVMARTLWDPKTPFARIVAESFRDAFGRDGAEVARVLTALSKLHAPFFDGVHIPKREDARIAAGLRNIPRFTPLLARLRTLAERNLSKRHVDAVIWSWRYLAEYADLMEGLLPGFAAYLRRDPATAERFEPAFERLRRAEKRLHPAVDVSSLIQAVGAYGREAANAHKAAAASTSS